jgi:uncharacterized membrane protein
MGVVVAIVWRIVVVWAELPETMASHFGLSGEPDAFTSKVGFFFIMAIVGGGTVAILLAAPSLLRRLPARWLNFPNRDYWLANDARREEALDRLSAQLGWMGFATTLMLAIAVELALRANIERTGLANGPFLVALGLYFAFVIALLVWMMRAFAVPRQMASE